MVRLLLRDRLAVNGEAGYFPSADEQRDQDIHQVSVNPRSCGFQPFAGFRDAGGSGLALPIPQSPRPSEGFHAAGGQCDPDFSGAPVLSKRKPSAFKMSLAVPSRRSRGLSTGF